MTPLQRIRENPDEVRATLEARGFKAPLDRIIELDAQVRKLLSESETLKAERNRASKGGPPSDAVKARMRELGDRIKTIDAELGTLQAERDAALLWIPNVIDPRVPRGKDEHEEQKHELPQHSWAPPDEQRCRVSLPRCAVSQTTRRRG